MLAVIFNLKILLFLSLPDAGTHCTSYLNMIVRQKNLNRAAKEAIPILLTYWRRCKKLSKHSWNNFSHKIRSFDIAK